MCCDPMPPNKIDLSAGSVLHVRGFSSRGHPPKDKFVLIIGQKSDSEVLGFLISSQLVYLGLQTHKNEVVKVPPNATAFLRAESPSSDIYSSPRDPQLRQEYQEYLAKRLAEI